MQERKHFVSFLFLPSLSHLALALKRQKAHPLSHVLVCRVFSKPIKTPDFSQRGVREWNSLKFVEIIRLIQFCFVSAIRNFIFIIALMHNHWRVRKEYQKCKYILAPLFINDSRACIILYMCVNFLLKFKFD